CHCMLLPPLLATSLIPPRSPPLPYTTLFRSVFTRTTAIGCYDHGYVVAVERRPRGERLWHFRAGRVVLATGAHERSLPFPGNDLPGVMLAAAARTYVNRYGVRPGNRAVCYACAE